MNIYYFLIFLQIVLSFYPHKSSTSIYPIKPSNRTQTKVIWSHWWRLKFGQRHTHTTDALDGQHHSTAASGARNVRWSQGFPTFDDVDDVSPLYFSWIDSIFKMFMFYNTDFGMCSFIVAYILVFLFPVMNVRCPLWFEKLLVGMDTCLTVCATNTWNWHVGHLWTYRWRVAGGTLLTTSGWHKNTWTYWTRWDVFVNG